MSDLVICVETFVRDGVPPGICTLVDEILCGEIALRGVSPERQAIKDVHTQTCSTASRCRASVVRKNIVLLTLARALSLCSTFCVNECKKRRALRHTRNCSLRASHNKEGSIPRSLAAFWIFKPCSSVPAKKCTGPFGSEMRAKRAKISAMTREYR
jgi:hypothetical protein